MKLQQQISLLSLASPWKKTLDPADMERVPKDATLSDLDESALGKDLALQDREGGVVGWIPARKVTQVLWRQWKICHAYYETLLETVDDAITAVDENGKIVSWNHRSEAIFEYPRDEIMGKPITDFFEQDALEVMSVLTEGKGGKGVFRKYHQPSPHVYSLINALPVVMNQRVIGGISVERDITDVVRLNNELSTTTAYIRDLEKQFDEQKAEDPFHKIKGRSEAIRHAVNLAGKVASTEASVLITGESGVGKELFASAIHKAGPRAEGPFIDINCGAIPTPLFESELFGYERGAFTGANKEGKKGKLDAAEGGTLFLDEIGEMPLDLQVKLLRVLQEKRFYRVGGTEPIPLDVRIIAATNRDLEEMIEAGRFREDLYYRLHVVSIRIPPLRERMEDIPELIQLCLNEFSRKYSKPVPELDPEVMYRFINHDWPGNVRQLRNLIERIMILTDGETIRPHHLPSNFTKVEESRVTNPSSLHPPVGDSEEMRIRNALTTTYGNKSAAAKLLGISRATLYNKMRKYHL
ncbi:sigma-54 interaction domain-containing protein [Kroppenstedtia eburnea]|uniref:sigma-54 interaction domain-containing protein n=1 Tax=Kroppenstedtia eburnea TaxID=714067 RepID=UPI0009711313|nr:sigma 54-interacting transcriptional regulator [Kroppenstedtia eburnea]